MNRKQIVELDKEVTRIRELMIKEDPESDRYVKLSRQYKDLLEQYSEITDKKDTQRVSYIKEIGGLAISFIGTVGIGIVLNSTMFYDSLEFQKNDILPPMAKSFITGMLRRIK